VFARFLIFALSLAFLAAPSLAAQAGKVAAVPAQAASRPIQDKWALVVGISRFQHPGIDLKYPAKDAKDFYQYLIGDGQFAPDHVILLTDERATRSNILSLIGDKWLPRLANPDDLVVIFVSTHGSPADADVGGVNYLIAHDTNPDSLYATGIPIQDLMRTIKKRVHSDRVVLIMDACHSGAGTADAKGLFRSGNVDASHVVAGTGQLVIASSRPDQLSWEAKKYPNSVFTKNLIDCLRKDGGSTKLGTAFKVLQERVQQEVLFERGQLQTPEMKSQWRGDDLMLATKPAQPRPGIPIETLALHSSDVQGQTDKVKPTVVMPPKTVLDNGDIYRVFNGPAGPTSFELTGSALLTYIFTYHWNDGKGSSPGTIALQNQNGAVFGPWVAAGKPGQGGVPNAYWEVEPMIKLKPGTYTILDSSPRTWSRNAGSGQRGIARVKVVPSVTSDIETTIQREPVQKIFANGNIYAVRNKPLMPTHFSIIKPTLITSVTNYHWNNGRGQEAGNITIVHQDGTVYGPWRAVGAAGQGNAPNVHWRCSVDAVLKPGLYMVLDSDSDTWSQNPESGGAGMTEILGVVQHSN
jgi:hypothetical protein